MRTISQDESKLLEAIAATADAGQGGALHDLADRVGIDVYDLVDVLAALYDGGLIAYDPESVVDRDTTYLPTWQGLALLAQLASKQSERSDDLRSSSSQRVTTARLDREVLPGA
jgi:predicted transcriptional regulator